MSQNFFTMQEIKYRAVVEFLYLNGLKAQEIYETMLKVYSLDVYSMLKVYSFEVDPSPTIGMIERWVVQFKRARISPNKWIKWME